MLWRGALNAEFYFASLPNGRHPPEWKIPILIIFLLGSSIPEWCVYLTDYNLEATFVRTAVGGIYYATDAIDPPPFSP